MRSFKGVGFRGLGFWVWGLGFRGVWVCGFRVYRAWGFRGLGFASHQACDEACLKLRV